MARCGIVLPVALLISGCAMDSHALYFSQYKDSVPSLFEAEPQPRQPDPPPDVKAIIKNDITAVFGHTDVKNVNVGPAHPNGNNWQACLRAEVYGITNADLGVQYFMVEINQGRVGLRRPATTTDKCETDQFEAI